MVVVKKKRPDVLSKMKNTRIRKIAITRKPAGNDSDENSDVLGDRVFFMKSDTIELIQKSVTDTLSLVDTDVDITDIQNKEKWEIAWKKFRDAYYEATFTPHWEADDGDYGDIRYYLSYPGNDHVFYLQLINMQQEYIGIDLWVGITDNDQAYIRAIWFSKSKFTPETAKSWLNSHLNISISSTSKTEGDNMSDFTKDDLQKLIAEQVEKSQSNIIAELKRELKVIIPELTEKVAKSDAPATQNGNDAPPPQQPNTQTQPASEPTAKSDQIFTIGMSPEHEKVLKSMVDNMNALAEKVDAMSKRSAPPTGDPAANVNTQPKQTSSGMHPFHELVQKTLTPGYKVQVMPGTYDNGHRLDLLNFKIVGPDNGTGNYTKDKILSGLADLLSKGVN